MTLNPIPSKSKLRSRLKECSEAIVGATNLEDAQRYGEQQKRLIGEMHRMNSLTEQDRIAAIEARDLMSNRLNQALAENKEQAAQLKEINDLKEKAETLIKRHLASSQGLFDLEKVYADFDSKIGTLYTRAGIALGATMQTLKRDDAVRVAAVLSRILAALESEYTGFFTNLTSQFERITKATSVVVKNALAEKKEIIVDDTTPSVETMNVEIHANKVIFRKGA